MMLTVAGLLYIERVSIIDFAATKYGFPYWWLIHVYVTFAGKTDIWSFEASNFIKDMILFFLLSLGFGILILLLKQRLTLTTKMKSEND